MLSQFLAQPRQQDCDFYRGSYDHSQDGSLFYGSTALAGQGLLLLEVSRSYADTPPSAGLLWTSDRPDAEASSSQHATLTKDRHSCPMRDANPHPQQARYRRPTPQTVRPPGSAYKNFPVSQNRPVFCICRLNS